MDRKKFLKNGVLGIGSIIAIPTMITSCKKEEEYDPTACATSPEETAGPFPIKTPADLVRENIIGNRTGVPFMMIFTIQNTNNAPLMIPLLNGKLINCLRSIHLFWMQYSRWKRGLIWGIWKMLRFQTKSSTFFISNPIMSF